MQSSRVNGGNEKREWGCGSGGVNFYSSNTI